MKYLIFLAPILFIATTIPAAAGCVGLGFDEPLTASEIEDSLNGMRINTTAPGGENSKEDHCSTGSLYKVGAGNDIDPRKKVGTWSASGGDHIQYLYDGNQQYTFKLYENANGDLCWESETGDTIATTASAPTPIPDGLTCAP